MDDLDFGATIKGFNPGQKVFSRYTLRKILGRGGMGVVWLARDGELDREVAMKFLPEIVSLDPEAVADLKRETRRNLELTHPHIVRIYDFVSDGRTAAITMEYIDGATLSALKLEKPGRLFSVAELTTWVGQLCAALTYAHTEAQVVHRDLKPANLMIDARDRLKIADFGIARGISDSVSRVSAQAGGSSGTPLYMSPQQMMGEKPSVADDIYSLGATLYELLTSKPPFHSGNVLLQVQSKTAPTIAVRRHEFEVSGEAVPAAWEEAIAACLAKEASGRPKSVEELWNRLSGKTTPPVMPARSATVAPAAAPPPPAKSKAPLIAALAGAVILLGAAGWYFGGYAPEQTRLAEIRRLEAQARSEAGAKERVRLEAEALKLRTEQERAAAETKAKAEQARLAAEHLAAARGGLVIRTTPAGAEVRVGAIALDKSPLTLKEQKPGQYPVKVRLDGYEDWTGEIEVKENDFAELDVTLTRSTGTVALSTEPSGLEAEVVGRVIPDAPPPADQQTVRTPRSLTLPTGSYGVTFRRPGWPEQKQKVEVMRNQSFTATADFAPGGLELTSAPTGAEVWQDGRRIEATTPYRVPETTPGRYDFELRLKGFKPAPMSVTVTTRQIAREHATLAKQNFPQPGQPWENTLGQKFVPVPGTDVLFCLWETRELDYAAFVSSTGRTWQSASAGNTHPAVNVSWDDAVAFCAWLTEKERREGKLGPDQSYRLPTDGEWSVAVGLREGGGTPRSKDAIIKGEYPWGTQWPPPRGAGNYASSLNVDTYERTAPVGSFTANRHGLHDLGGNVWEWCQDFYDGNSGARVVRGASFGNHDSDFLLSSYRLIITPDSRYVYFGFRVVVAVGSVSGEQASAPSKPDFSIKSPTATANKPTVGTKWTIPDLNLDLQPIAPGTFMMGSATGGGDERPVTQATLTQPFWLGRTEVTQAQYEAISGTNPSTFRGPDRPVEKVSWDEVMAFCRKLTERERAAGRLPEGYAYTLPTEAQWEYACRAGTTGDYAGDLDAMGWYRRNSGGTTHPVGQKQPNAWGLYDMHGNVYEWCLDWYGAYPGGSVSDPTGSASVFFRVRRGGCWNHSADYCRSAFRFYFEPGLRVRDLGFRLALAPSR